MSETKTIVVYTDGSCARNGKNGSSGGIGIHFPNKELKDISKVFRLDNCTNQRTELYAILISIKYIKSHFNLKDYKILIKSDSEYSINSITKWINGWIKNGWKTQKGDPVANRELIEDIYKYYSKYDIKIEHVAAHTNQEDSDSIANAKADELARKATKRRQEETKNTSSKDTSQILRGSNYIIELVKR